MYRPHLANLTFTPPYDIDYTTEIRWMVQPINNGMLGIGISKLLLFAHWNFLYCWMFVSQRHLQADNRLREDSQNSTCRNQQSCQLQKVRY